MDQVSGETKPRTGAPAPVADEQQSADAECVRRTLSGEVRAFDELIERYQRRIVSVAYRLLGNSHDAADVCQEAFLRAFRSLETLHEPHRFSASLTRIAGTLALNFRRGRRASVSLSEEETAAAVIDGGASKGLVEITHDPALTRETLAAIEAAVARLPEKQRLSLILFAIEGLPQKEVADILECGVEAVKWNVFQARKKLKDELAEYLVE